jgi:Cu(I)/Ag(I) efflux system membrane protein CusA/SilA
MLAVPFSAVGALLLLNLLDYHLSIAVWVGLIALMGLDAETGVFMLLFLDLSVNEARRRGELSTDGQLVEAIVHGAVKRVRPKAMTVAAAMLGLLPIMWSTGAGADLMKRIAAPMVGGLITSFALELLVYPAVYLLWMRRAGLKNCAPTDMSYPVGTYPTGDRHEEAGSDGGSDVGGDGRRGDDEERRGPGEARAQPHPSPG